MSPAVRIGTALAWGSQIHARTYREEYDDRHLVAWHRVPWTLGCAGTWTDP
jgi:monoamine oxidase